MLGKFRELLSGDSHVARDVEKPTFLTEQWIRSMIKNISERQTDPKIKKLLEDTEIESLKNGLTKITLRHDNGIISIEYLQASQHSDSLSITTEKISSTDKELVLAAKLLARELQQQKNKGFHVKGYQELDSSIQPHEIIDQTDYTVS